MANLIGLDLSTNPIVWADHANDYGDVTGTASLEKQITLATLASAAARQGVKADMATIATTHLANRFAVLLRLEWDVAPADGTSADLYWSPSPNSTAGTLNSGAASGADAAYTGSAGSTIAETVLQLQFIGSLQCTNDAATVVQQAVFITTLPMRYGSPVLVNNGGQALEGDDIEMCIAFYPLEDEAQ